MKKSFLTFLALALMLTSTAFYGVSKAYACGKDDGQCPLKNGRGGESNHDGCPIVKKFLMTAHEYLEHRKQIGLSEQQVSDIKGMKLEMKKSMIRNMANMQVFMLDMKQQLSATTLNSEAINSMIDQQMSTMAAGAKETVAAYVKLRSVLTADQQVKFKNRHHANNAA